MARPCWEEGRAARGIGFGEGQNLAEDDNIKHFLVPSPNVLSVVLYIAAFPKHSGGKNRNL